MSDALPDDTPVDGTTALVVLVPEAEPVVGALRAVSDPAAVVGVPAHVTILYPFVDEAAWTPDVDARLAALFRRHATFDARFRRTARFGTTTLYLVPEPAERFSALIDGVVAEFPTHPPYGGAFAVVIPHLTVADRRGVARLEAAEAALAGAPPIATRVGEIAQLVAQGGRWHDRKRWALRGPCA